MMGTLRIIPVAGPEHDIGYEGREPPLAVLQRAVGGYIEHVAVDYQGKRRSAYVNEEARLPGPAVQSLSGTGVIAVKDARPNVRASTIAGMRILGTMVIDLGG